MARHGNNTIFYAFLVFLIGFNTHISTSQPTGEEVLQKHIKAAVAKKRAGFLQSAKTGAKHGTVAAAGLIGAGMVAEGQRFGHVEIHGVDVAGMTQLLAMGAAGGAIWAMLNDAFRKGSTPEWIAQLQELNDKISSISKKVMYLGVPGDKVSPALEKGGYIAWFKNFATGNKYVRKSYLLSSAFDDKDRALDCEHYELYLMPKDDYLVDIFLAVHDFLKLQKINEASAANAVAFIALRPTPGITKSPYNAKNLPRIIIGFKHGATKKDVINIAQMLDEYFKTAYTNYLDVISLDVQPRYSQQLNKLMYAAYGSADCKDEAGAQEEFARKKAKTFWQRWVSGPTDIDMAYKTPDLAINPGETINEELSTEL
jgi:hypothetical protein